MKRMLRFIEDKPEWLLWFLYTYVNLITFIFVAINGKLNSHGFGIALCIWFTYTFIMFSWQHKKLKEHKRWVSFHEKYGKPYCKISIPMTMYADFDAHFFLHDEHGNVKMSAKTEEEAIEKHNKTGLYIVRIIETQRR